MNVSCSECRYFTGFDRCDDYEGRCHRYPHWELKDNEDWCGEFRPKLPEQEVLDTELIMLPRLTDRSRRILHSLGCKTLGDILLIGRSSICKNGIPDKQTIGNLILVFEELGVEW